MSFTEELLSYGGGECGEVILNVVFKTSPSNPLSHENIPGAGLGSGSQIFLSREARGTYGSREASNLMMYHRLLNLGTMNIWGSIILCYE